MIQNAFKFCPMCASKKIQYLDGKKWFCPECGFDLYNNVASAVGIIIYDDFDNVLFEVRAKEPKKGFLALPGGFCDYDESAEQAVLRECLEETGLVPEKVEFLCTFPNDYLYKNIAYKTCDIFFTAKVSEKYGTVPELIKSLKKQECEVVSFKSIKISSKEELENTPLAFISSKKTLSKWLEEKQKM